MPERQETNRPKEPIHGGGPYTLDLGQVRNEATGALEYETFVYTGGPRADCFKVVRRFPKGFMGNLKPTSHREPKFDEVYSFLKQFRSERAWNEALYINDAWNDYLYKQEREAKRILRTIDDIAGRDHGYSVHKDLHDRGILK